MPLLLFEWLNNKVKNFRHFQRQCFLLALDLLRRIYENKALIHLFAWHSLIKILLLYVMCCSISIFHINIIYLTTAVALQTILSIRSSIVFRLDIKYQRFMNSPNLYVRHVYCFVISIF